MNAKTVKVGVRIGMDEVIMTIFAYEVPLLVFNHGSSDRVRLISVEDEVEIDNMADEWKRLKQRWGRAAGTGGRSVVDVVFQGGDVTLPQRIRDGDAVVEAMSQRADAETGGGKVQPRAGDPGYLDKAELAGMLKELTGVAGKTSLRRNTLRANVILAIEEGYLALNLKAPVMDTDPEVIAAYEGWVEAKTEAARAGG